MSVTVFDIGASASSKDDASVLVSQVFGFCPFPSDFSFQSHSPSMLVLPEVSLILSAYQVKTIRLKGMSDLISVSASLAQIARLRGVTKLLTISYDDGIEDALADARVELVKAQEKAEQAIGVAEEANLRAEKAMLVVNEVKAKIIKLEADLKADQEENTDQSQANIQAEHDGVVVEVDKVKTAAELKAEKAKAAAEARAKAKAELMAEQGLSVDKSQTV